MAAIVSGVVTVVILVVVEVVAGDVPTTTSASAMPSARQLEGQKDTNQLQQHHRHRHRQRWLQNFSKQRNKSLRNMLQECCHKMKCDLNKEGVISLISLP